MSATPRACRPIATAVALALVAILSAAGSAAAASPRWSIETSTAPTALAPGASGLLIVAATNLGDQEIDAASVPVTLAERLPPDLKATAIAANVGGTVEMGCTLASLTCTTASPIPPYHRLEVLISVTAGEPGAGDEGGVAVAGGEARACRGVPAGMGRFTDAACLQEGAGNYEKTSAGPAPEASATQTVALSAAETRFGVERYAFQPEDEHGTPDRQAGSHPFQLTSVLDLNQIVESNGFELDPAAPGLLRNVRIDLPAGLLGDPQAIPQCPAVDFSAIGSDNEDACPPETAIGVAVTRIAHPLGASPGRQTDTEPVFNLAPAPGEPARFGFEVAKVPVIFDTAIRTGGDYGVVVSVNSASQAAQAALERDHHLGRTGSGDS